MVSNDCVASSKAFAQAMKMNGMIANAVPRFIDDSSRKNRRRGEKAACLGDGSEQSLQTGMMADDPSTVHTDESRYNTKGLGHIGWLGAYLDDLDSVGLSQTYLDNLYGSAGSFIQMWEAIP